MFNTAKEEMDRIHHSLDELAAEGNAGGGMVRVRVNGRMEVLACVLSDEVLGMNDREMLEDLICAATNQALQRIRKLVAEETSKMADGLGLPSGLALPGLE